MEQLQNIEKTTLKNFLRDTFILAQRKWLKIKHSPDQLLDIIIMPTVFMLLFTFLFGGAVSGDTKSYMLTIVPGMMIFALLSACSSTGSQLQEDLETGIFDRFKSLPISRISPLSGTLVADLPRYLIAGTISSALGFLLGWRPGGGIIAVILGVLLSAVFAWAISWIFAFIGLETRSASAVSGLSQVVMIVLVFLSNAFVPTDTLPRVLQLFTKLNPVTHVISAFSEITSTGNIFNTELAITMLISIIVVIIFAPLTLRAYNKKMYK